MAATLLDVMDGLEARLLTIPGLRVASETPGQVNPPQAVIGVPDVTYHATHDHSDDRTWQLYALTSATVDRVGQRLLAELAAPSGPRSIRETLETDRTLGGVVADLRVTSFRMLGLREVGIIGYYGGLFTVDIIGS